MTPEQEAEFELRAARFGHDVERLKAGETLVSDLRLAYEETRRIPAATDDQRAARTATFFNPVIAARRRLGQGVHDRCEFAALVGGEVDAEDRANMAQHFPMPVRVTSVRRMVVAAGSVWDVSVRGEELGLDERDDLIVVVNVGELVLEPAARLIVQGNLFFLLCQRVVRLEDPSQDPADLAGYDIGVLATPYSVDPGSGPLHGFAGSPGGPGHDGADGVAPRYLNTLLGPRLTEQLDLARLRGADGGEGGHGEAGGRGRTGGAAKLAEVALREIVGQVTVLAGAGDGGNGGAGGDGGDGGNGGDGADGFIAIEREVPVGDGGSGGVGGNGGDGGRGGHGGIASNVYVVVPDDALGRIRLIPRPALGGVGGQVGRGGGGGTGGQGGALGAVPILGAHGRGGSDGTNGVRGRGGRSRPAAPMYVNEKAYEAPSDPLW